MPPELSGGKDQPLSGGIHRHIGRPLNHVEGLKMNPHGMGGIGEVAVSKGVGGEQVAELVVGARLGECQELG